MNEIDKQLFEAAGAGDVPTMQALLAEYPDKLAVRDEPYEHTLLHVAARNGRLDAVGFLLSRGIDPNVKERGDRTYPMHWAAAAGHLDVVRHLADAGGDVVGHGDDHGLEVIGWASFWEGCDDDAHQAVVDFLVSRGAKHHIFSAISLNLPEQVRRIVAERPGALNSRLTRNDNHQTALHHAVAKNRPEMVKLLLELGADALAVDGTGESIASYATTPDIDRPVMSAIRAMTLDELGSAEGGSRKPNLQARDLVAALVLEDWPLAERLIAVDSNLVNGGALHLMAKRNALMAAQWLLGHGANVNQVVRHWGSAMTALHLAIWHHHPDMLRLLRDAGADPTIKDSMHEGDAFDWADHFERPELRRILEGG